MILIVVLAIAAIVVVVALVVRSQRSNDGVDSFRRQIDALSPEARRPVVDQVQSAADRQSRDEPPADDTDPSVSDDDEPGDGDGVRGT